MSPVRDVRVLLIEDDPDLRLAGVQALEMGGFSVEAHESVEAADSAMSGQAPVVIVSDVRLPGCSGIEWQKRLHTLDPELPVILVTGQGDIAMAVEAMRAGAYDFIEKPFTAQRLLAVVHHAAEKRAMTMQLRSLRDQLHEARGVHAAIIGQSERMERVRKTVLSLADTPVDVVIYGETGTGKDLVARALHDHSDRRQGPLVALNCGGLTEALADSELFGHEVGSFTGAVRARVGKLEHAQRGTLFLDEIESMPLSVQVKLLRALQERSIERLGSNKPIPIDCRVIAASKVDLKTLSDQHKFRADLFYRIGVAFIELPPLRERVEDIPVLFEHFAGLAAQRYRRELPPIGAAQLAALMRHDWPGNVRELRNVADRHVLGLLDDNMALLAGQAADGLCLSTQMSQFERALIGDALRRCQGEVAATAKSLGLPKQTLYDKLRRLDLRPEAFKAKGD
jgi:two-component system C4-dicarboxylate transport response regulator DctD